MFPRGRHRVKIGLDFDNTIVCYDRLFHQIAFEKGLIPADLPATKTHVRDYLRQTGREQSWIELQGIGYGARLQEAEPFPGVEDFFVFCKEQGVAVEVISHKTQFPFLGPRDDLHCAAREWLLGHGFFDATRTNLTIERVHLRLTKKEKLDCIAELGCTHFVDDLPEFLSEPDFPARTEKILFDPNNQYPNHRSCPKVNSWNQIQAILLHVSKTR